MLSIVTDLDSVFVCYRVLPRDLLPTLKNRDLSTYDQEFLPDRVAEQSLGTYPLFDFGSDIQKAGYISRGITFGNRQNLFVNSTLNLQMQGAISDNMNIEAVITDQNVPFQPEGNTQNLRDFDNVLIRLYNENLDLRAGDIVFENPFEEAYFLKYRKNVQGLQLNYQTKLGAWNSKTSLATSAAKGKFASVAVPAIEGSQGPYQLQGPNGERFIFILANSEKIYVDGRLLDRGFDRDYVIDYNLAQITFNANVLITQFSVIRVDYEYVEQFYTRTSTALAQSLSNKNTSIRVNYYQERDNRSGALGFTPGENDLALLRMIGDDQSLAQIEGVDSVGFSLDRILYKKADSLDLDGVTQSVFVYSTNPDSAHFAVSFTEVGFGNGDYELEQSTANGRIFRWVSPQGGFSQGNYQPARQVPLPISKQMTTIGVTQKISEHESVTQEVAVSNIDKNLYSSVDDDDNQAIAWMGNFSTEGRELFPEYKLKSRLSWELDQRSFNPIDRYRSINFDRDWDFDPSESSRDLFLFLNFGLEKNESQKITYDLINRDRSNQLSGVQHNLTLNQRLGKFFLEGTTFLAQNEQAENNSDWIRTEQDVSFRNGKIVPGYRFSADQNLLKRGDSIISSRMYFHAHEYYLQSADSLRSKFRLSYQSRLDEIPLDGRLQDFLHSQNYRGSFQSVFGTQELELTGTYRKVQDKRTDLMDEWLNARLGWSGKLFNESISQRLTYQVGNVRELKRDFIYILVGGNQGTHAWRDENGDGIKDLNEFYEAVNLDERQYAKFYTPTDEFINAFETRYQHLITGKFPVSWRNHGGLRAWLTKWEGRLNLSSHFKTTSKSLETRLNPFTDARTSSVLFASNRWSQFLTFNKNGDGLGWEGSHSRSMRKSLLTNGFELGDRETWTSALRWRFNREYTLRLKNSHELFDNESDFLESRNLQIKKTGIGPEILWQPSTAFRLTGAFDLRKSENLIQENPASTDITEINSTFTLNQAGKGTFNGTIRWIKIDFEGEQGTYTAYQLLEALRPGQNTTWRINWQQTLGKGIQMTLQYNGRSSEDQAPIHTGTVVMTAFF